MEPETTSEALESSEGRPTLEGRVNALQARWQEYLERGTFEHFVEFALTLNSLTEQFNRLKLPGLIRLCEGLENTSLALFGDPSTHPIQPQEATTLQRQIEILAHAIKAAQPKQQDARRGEASDTGKHDINATIPWAKPRDVWVIADEDHPWVAGLIEQFSFFGFRMSRGSWTGPAPHEQSPLVMLFIPSTAGYEQQQIQVVKQLRLDHPTSQLFCLSVPKSLSMMVQLLRAGADVTIQPDQEITTVLARVLELVQMREQDPARVLLVEDSPTAVAVIQRALSQHGIGSHAISNPQQLLAAMELYRPDLVLMDMYMPHCTGVEATRVMRQLSTYQSLPVIYLSSERDMSMQIEALRLGGDQFLTKPCNPLLLSATVKTKIERYRDMQRTSQHDSLTGLLNHSAAKTRLAQILHAMNPARDRLCVVMLDIDHFKSINDSFGHPVGDQVIRSLAWLLKARMRATDVIGRYGGEEFLLVLRDISLDDAVSVIDRIRRDFASMPHAHSEGTLRATFSAGIAFYPVHENVADLTKAADDALLEAKRNGRNRVERGTL
jgi:diguanylate cyclase (GGDEF)-like protein